jgi:hypothetical protein
VGRFLPQDKVLYDYEFMTDIDQNTPVSTSFWAGCPMICILFDAGAERRLIYGRGSRMICMLFNAGAER